MNKVKHWVNRNSRTISWTIIVFCLVFGIVDLLIGSYVWAAFQFFLAWVNYSMLQ